MPYLQFWLGARGPKGAPDCGVNGALMGGRIPGLLTFLFSAFSRDPRFLVPNPGQPSAPQTLLS